MPSWETIWVPKAHLWLLQVLDLSKLLKLPIPLCFCTHFLFQRVSKPTAEAPSVILLPSAGANSLPRDPEGANTRNLSACNNENWSQTHLKIDVSVGENPFRDFVVHTPGTRCEGSEIRCGDSLERAARTPKYVAGAPGNPVRVVIMELKKKLLRKFNEGVKIHNSQTTLEDFVETACGEWSG